MKASVILTSYNRPVLLYRAAKSVLNQDYTGEIELIICDDNSKEDVWDTLISIDSMFDHAPNRSLLVIESYKSDRGRRIFTDYARNINTGLLASTGDILFYLTDDDEFLPNHVSEIMRFFEQNAHASVAFGQQIVEELDDLQLTTRHVGTRYNDDLESAACMIDHNQFAHRWDVLEKAGFWPEHKVHYGACDAAFFTQLKDAGFHFYAATPKPTSRHRLHYKSVQGKMLNNEEPNYD